MRTSDDEEEQTLPPELNELNSSSLENRVLRISSVVFALYSEVVSQQQRPPQAAWFLFS